VLVVGRGERGIGKACGAGLVVHKAGHDGKRSRAQPQNANQRCFLLQKPEYCVIAVGSGRTKLFETLTYN
jgi:hypothetical protein